MTVFFDAVQELINGLLTVVILSKGKSSKKFLYRVQKCTEILKTNMGTKIDLYCIAETLVHGYSTIGLKVKHGVFSFILMRENA